MQGLRAAGSTNADRVRAIVVVDVHEARPLVSPSYDDGATSEADMIRIFQARFDQLHEARRPS